MAIDTSALTSTVKVSSPSTLQIVAPSTQTVQAPKTSFWDTFDNISNKLITAGSGVAETIGIFKGNNVKPYSSGSSMPDPTPKSNTKLYLIAGGVVVAGIITAIVLKKRKKKALSGTPSRKPAKKRRTKKRA